MEKYLKAIFDLTKLPTKFFLVLAVISGTILFGSEALLSKLKLLDKINDVGWIFGLIFLITSGIVIVNIFLWLFKYFRTKKRISKLKKEFTERLQSLDPHEKAVIREFMMNGQSSIDMPIDNPVISGLLTKNILKINKQLDSGFIMSGSYTSVSLNPYADKMLKLEDLDMSNDPTEEQIENAQNNRPKWATQLNPFF